MKQKLKNIVLEIYDLEQKCQNGENVSENMAIMEDIFSKLSFSELYQVIDKLEKLEK